MDREPSTYQKYSAFARDDASNKQVADYTYYNDGNPTETYRRGSSNKTGRKNERGRSVNKSAWDVELSETKSDGTVKTDNVTKKYGERDIKTTFNDFGTVLSLKSDAVKSRAKLSGSKAASKPASKSKTKTKSKKGGKPKRSKSPKKKKAKRSKSPKKKKSRK